MIHFDLVHKIFSYINLESEVDDFDKIHESIEKDLNFKGTNLWILAFAIIIASVGLNMNSTAVIIGAMLISPLMGPINGMGYSIATYNMPLFRKAAKNFSFAVIASLIASTAYFAITPISTAHSELLARTSPTIYDVLIALFGGLAGIVAISSRQKGNVIPGVAIATALMPPLCTSGYGLATGQWNFFFGAFYLFTINTVFIAISSVVISQILQFPIRTLVDADQKTRVNRLISLVIAIVLIPSIYFGYNLVQKEKFVGNANDFVKRINVVEGSYLLKHDIDASNRKLLLIYGGSTLSDEQKGIIRDRANDFSLEEATIEYQQGFSFDEIANQSNEANDLKAEMNRLNLIVKEKDRVIQNYEDRKHLGSQILDEVKIMYPQVLKCSYAETYIFIESQPEPERVDLVVLTLEGKKLPDKDREKIETWLKTRLNSEKVKVYFEN